MSMLGEQIKELRWLADHLDETERGMDEYVRAMREAADTIEKLEPYSNQLEPLRWHELFGTPERAARTLYYGKQPICAGCALLDECDKMPDEEQDTCLLIDHDALLEWLRGDA